MLDLIGKAIASATLATRMEAWPEYVYPQKWEDGLGSTAGYIFYSNGEVYAIDVRRINDYRDS